jgi:hypothetical protein
MKQVTNLLPLEDDLLYSKKIPETRRLVPFRFCTWVLRGKMAICIGGGWFVICQPFFTLKTFAIFWSQK